MRIGIDGRLAGSAHAGIGRYTEELLRGLFGLKTNHEWIIFLRDKGQLPWVEKEYPLSIRWAPITHYTVREQLQMPVLLKRERCDVIHIPHFNVPVLYNGPYVVTIHDLLWHERRDRHATTLSPVMHALKYHAYRYITEKAIQRAKHVIVPTEHIKHVVQRYTTQDHISVTYEGISQAYSTYGETATRTYPYLVYTGSLYPHKNVVYALDVLAHLPELHFVVISSRSVFHSAFWREVKVRKLENRVHMEGYLPDEDVAALYRASVGLIFPSFSEGFGLPGLEAMASGAVVFASDIPVFREVYGKAAYYVDPRDVLTCVRGLLAVQKDEPFRAALKREAKKQLERYSWQEMAKSTVAIYEHVGSVV